jgi:membrane dipeptidase
MRFFDAHCDAVMHSYDGPFDFVNGDARPAGTRSHVDLPRLQAGGHCVQLFAVFASQRYYGERDVRPLAREAITTIHGWAAASDGRLRLIRTVADLHGVCSEDAQGIGNAPSIGALIGMEGADPLAAAEDLREFCDLGVRLVIPAWDDNHFSGTVFGGGAGLSDEGRKLVQLAEELRVMVDVSHASDTAFEEIVGLTRRPFVASHSNCRAVSASPRNLTNPQIRKLAARGGVMGLNFAPDFLDPDYLAAWNAIMAPMKDMDSAARQKYRTEVGPTVAAIPLPGLDAIVRQAQHAVNIGGEACVGLGGDLDGIGAMPAGLTGAQDYLRVAEALSVGGFTERQVELICHGNMLRVFGEILPV